MWYGPLGAATVDRGVGGRVRGAGDGHIEGNSVGFLVGRSVDGRALGHAVGFGEGQDDGNEEGRALGNTVGAGDGRTVGKPDGARVGRPVLGNVVGNLVGLAVVGNAVGTPHNGLSPALQYPCSLQYDEEGDETGWVEGSGDSQELSHPPQPPLVPVLLHSSRRRYQPPLMKSSYIE